MSVVQAPVPGTTESQYLRDALERLCEQYHLVAIYAFGSRATEIAAREEANFQLYVLRRAADLAPYERERRRMILAGEAM